MKRRSWVPVWLLVTLLLVLVASAAPAGQSDDKPELVSPEEYPVYDRIVESKFLTSETQLVLIERMTTTQLHPEQQQPLTRTSFEAKAFFEGRLSRDVGVDFVMKNHRPSKLETRFNFGVRYVFVSGEGIEQPEVSIPAMPAGFSRAHPVQEAPTTIDRLAFSRVAFSQRKDLALVYVQNPRADGTGAGFLVWLQRRGATWDILDTDLLWVSNMEEQSRPRR